MKILLAVYSQLKVRERLVVAGIVAVRLLLVGFDLAGIFLVGVVVSLVSGTVISSTSSLATFLNFIQRFGLENNYVGLATIAIIFFIFKGIFSVALTYATAQYVAKLEADKASSIYRSMIHGDLDRVEGYSRQELIQGLTHAVNATFSQGITTGTSILGEFALLISVSGYLAITSPVLFLEVALLFGAVGFLMSLILGKASGRSAYKAHVDLLQVQGLLLGTLANYRQLVTGRSAASFEEKFRVKRTSMTRESAIYGTITNLPRYITEIAVMVGVGLLIAQRSNGSGPGIPAPTIAIFLAGIFRIVASMLPIQSGLSQLRRIEPEGKIALDLIEKFKDAEPRDDQLTTTNTGLDILVRDLSFRYSGSNEYVFKDVNFTIEPGSYVAIVGKSGQGKSTLADLLMGLRAPDSGKILIGGKPPYRSGDLGYVPQTTSLIEGTLFENLTMLVGASPSEAQILKANNIIDSLELRPMVDAIPGGLMGQVGPGSFEMSGGQAQRVGLARALFFEPKVLILDEATSALDNQTESVIHEVLTRLRGSTTILVIAHRPQTIADAHQLLTVANGRILARTN